MQLVNVLDHQRRGTDTEAMFKRAGQRVRTWRHDHNEMSQVELARLAGVSVGCIQGLEMGTRVTRATNLAKVADVIGMSVQELTQEDEPSPGRDARLSQPGDEKLKAEDFNMARQFHHADTDTRLRVRRLLTTGIDPLLDLAERIDRLDQAYQIHVLDLVAKGEAQLAAEQSALDRQTKFHRRKHDPPTT